MVFWLGDEAKNLIFKMHLTSSIVKEDFVQDYCSRGQDYGNSGKRSRFTSEYGKDSRGFPGKEQNDKESMGQY